MKHILSVLHRFTMPALLALGVIFVLFTPDESQAVVCNGSNFPAPCFMPLTGEPGTCNSSGSCVANIDPDGTCTSDEEFNYVNVGVGAGMITVIIKQVKKILMGDSEADPPTTALWLQLFNGIANNEGFQETVSAAMVLYVIIYGATFMLGMVQLTVFDFFLRMVKIGVVAVLLHANAAQMFTQTFVHFFNDGTDDIITMVSSIGDEAMEGEPFDWMDTSIQEMTSVKMMVTLMAAAFTGPYGLIIIAVLLLSLYTYVKAMLYALWIYIMALTMRTLLFGLAPLFLSCLLFQRTRHLFDGWLNQLVNSCLQPIFLFTFFSFFVQLITSQFDLITNLDVCWTEQALFAGAPNEAHYWRFALFDCAAGIWKPFDGQWDFTGPVGAVTGAGCEYPVHPMGIMVPLALWILTDLAKRFNFIVVAIAKEIANASTDFDYRGKPMFGRTIRGDTRSPGGKPGGPPGPPPGGGGLPGTAMPRSGPPSLLPTPGTKVDHTAGSHKPNRGRSAEETRRRIEGLAGKRASMPSSTPPTKKR